MYYYNLNLNIADFSRVRRHGKFAGMTSEEIQQKYNPNYNGGKQVYHEPPKVITQDFQDATGRFYTRPNPYNNTPPTPQPNPQSIPKPKLVQPVKNTKPKFYKNMFTRKNLLIGGGIAGTGLAVGGGLMYMNNRNNKRRRLF